MKTMLEAIQNRNDFEDFIYEEKSHASLFVNGRSIYFGGGYFYFDEHDDTRFLQGSPVKRNYCTIEEIRRRLLEKEANGELNDLDQYEENQLIAQIVSYYAI